VNEKERLVCSRLEVGDELCQVLTLLAFVQERCPKRVLRHRAELLAVSSRYLTTCSSLTPSGSARTLQGSAVVIIGVDRVERGREQHRPIR
jgi:hypothetical protein